MRKLWHLRSLEKGSLRERFLVMEKPKDQPEAQPQAGEVKPPVKPSPQAQRAEVKADVEKSVEAGAVKEDVAKQLEAAKAAVAEASPAKALAVLKPFEFKNFKIEESVLSKVLVEKDFAQLGGQLDLKLREKLTESGVTAQEEQERSVGPKIIELKRAIVLGLKPYEHLDKFLEKRENQFINVQYTVNFDANGNKTFRIEPGVFTNTYAEFLKTLPKPTDAETAEKAKAANEAVEERKRLREQLQGYPILQMLAKWKIVDLNAEVKDAQGNSFKPPRDGWDGVLDGKDQFTLAILDFFGYGEEYKAADGVLAGMISFAPA